VIEIKVVEGCKIARRRRLHEEMERIHIALVEKRKRGKR